LCGEARAEEPTDDPDVQIARRYFAAGLALYEQGHFATAAAQFRRAQRIKPLAAFAYNIARCYDRLDRPSQAIAAYEAYLTGDPAAPDSLEVRARIGALRARVEERRPRYLAPAVVGAVSAAMLATGAGLWGSAANDFRSLQSSCAPHCPTDSWKSLPGREYAGEAVLGVAAALAVVDVVLFLRARRAASRRTP
jgi:tetratricopeptide (TPR) repeat protein